MIKCPNCGSTAQVKEIGCYDDNKKFVEKFLCGCGCQFNKNHYWCGDTIYLVNVEIINSKKNFSKTY